MRFAPLLLLACTSKPSTIADDTGQDTGTAPADLREGGPYAVSAATGTETVADDCDLAYTRYTPEGAAPDTLVVLAHGFARSAENMAGWGEHFASWGLDVVVPSLCHSSAFDADHEQNAADMAALADALGATRVLYAGHSAGGLAAILAGAADPRAIAVLGLDPVDTTLGVDAAGALDIPLYAVIGEASYCNTDNNSISMLEAAPQSRGLRAVEADHCDFENPTDDLCTLFCSGTNDTWTDEQINATVGGMATAFLLWQTGLDPDGEAWWTPGGASYEALLADGALEEL